ncbi:AAA family ATPase [Streptococcus dentapri]|uniref:Nuclease SbcCD subunit C n=1 Tax=Streptococcus dentapri TaxID=573564 RepID=A0ABV8D0G2_9STRE
MKPIRLEMTNFGPYREAGIDFSALDESSLFLISGRTGAGKSSIFDAMTYALYDETSSDKQVNELRSTFADFQDPKTKVTFYFEHHNQLYRVKRELDLKPRKKIERGKGIGTATASLTVVDSVGGLELDKLAGKAKETTQAVEALLQLTAVQFKQIILLPQYQFSQFLKSSTKDKIPILRKIFGTQIFESFEKRLIEKWQAANKKQEVFRTNLANQFTSQIWTQEERQAFEGQSDEENLKRAQDFLSKQQEVAKQDKLTQAEAKKRANQADKVYQEAQSLTARLQERAESQLKYQTEILDKRDLYQSKRQALKEFTFARDLADLVDKENAKRTSISQLQLSFAKLQEQVGIKKEELQPLEDKLAILEKEQAQHEERYQSLQVLNLQLHSAEELVKQEQAQRADQEEYFEIQENLKNLQEQKASLEQQREALEANRLNSQQLEDSRELLRVVQDLVKDKLHSCLANLRASNASLQELDLKLAQATTEREQVESAFEKLAADLKIKKQDQLKLMIVQLQAELSEGEACPVCGSLDHPVVETAQVKQDQFKMVIQAVEDLENQHYQKQQELHAIQFSQEQLRADRAARQQEEIELQEQLAMVYRNLQDLAAAKLPDLTWTEVYSDQLGQEVYQTLKEQDADLHKKAEQEKQDLEQLADSLSQLTTKEQELANRKYRLEGQIGINQKVIQNLQERFPDLEPASYYKKQIKQIKQAYQQFRQELENSQRQVAEHKEDISSLQGRLETEDDHLQKEQSELTDLEKQLTSALEADSALTHSRQELEGWIGAVRMGERDQLQQWLSQYDERQIFLEERLASFKDLEGQAQPDLETILIQKKAADDGLIQAEQEQTRSDYRSQQLHQLVTQIQEITVNAGQHFQSFNQLTSLKNIISGTESGSQRIKLETYVMQEYLEEVLNYANDHYIGLLSNQQFEFLISKEQSGNSQSGLDINIYDRASNKELPASSLSGGETFIASLAIALSLSEVVQNTSNGALVETLFIDEGFGSLDEDTLDKAIAVLEQIGQNRMVGVISHVKEMKDNIQQQLLIDKTPDGSSHIRMVI